MRGMESNYAKVSYWSVYTDKNEYLLSEAEFERLMQASSTSARFVMFDDCMLNVSFVKEAKRIVKNISIDEFNPLPKELKRFQVGLETIRLEEGVVDE